MQWINRLTKTQHDIIFLKKCSILVFFFILGVITACTSPPVDNEPRLVKEETLAPVTATPLRLLTATALPAMSIQNTQIASGDHPNESPASGFVTVTPPNTLTSTATDTPTRTPTLTPTRTTTPSRTPSPTITLSPTSTLTPAPTSTLSPEQIAASSAACASTWFFFPPPPGCPRSEPVTSLASYQFFQGGMMIAVKNERVIYILFYTPRPKAWILAADTYNLGVSIPDTGLTPPAGYLQPDTSFGLIWASDTTVRQQLGWAFAPQTTYTAVVQVQEKTETRYISGAAGEIFSLAKDQSVWRREH